MKIVSLGCGNMASGIVQGAFHKIGPKLQTFCYTPSEVRAKDLALKVQGVHLKKLEELKNLKDIDFIMIACKPQQVKDLALELSNILPKDIHIVSILAGVEIESLQKLFNSKVVTRIMPSTPVLVGEGISLVLHSEFVNSAQKKSIQSFFSECSLVVNMETEEKLDIVTTVSGCGPAYIFNFAEALSSALIFQGIDREVARTVVKQLFTGASALMEHSKDTSFSELERNVTSKGGITAEALAVFNRYNLSEITREAIAAALKRTEELRKLAN